MKLRQILTISFAVLAMGGCTSYKNVPYMQDTDVMGKMEEKLPMYDAKIMPKDMLTITVNTLDPESAAPFNLTVQSAMNASRTNTLIQQPTLQQYLVSNEGTIDFPVLGTLKVAGLTKSEIEKLIGEKLELGDYLGETPIVTVRITNYRVSVLGEVQRPGVFTITNEKISVFEALAMAGDLTIWGMRDNVKLIREDAEGQREVHYLDLTKADILASPYYYLQQNDVLYVTPNTTKAKNSDIGQSTSFWFSGTSILISLVNFVTNLILR